MIKTNMFFIHQNKLHAVKQACGSNDSSSNFEIIPLDFILYKRRCSLNRLIEKHHSEFENWNKVFNNQNVDSNFSLFNSWFYCQFILTNSEGISLWKIK